MLSRISNSKQVLPRKSAIVSGFIASHQTTELHSNSQLLSWWCLLSNCSLNSETFNNQKLKKKMNLLRRFQNRKAIMNKKIENNMWKFKNTEVSMVLHHNNQVTKVQSGPRPMMPKRTDMANGLKSNGKNNVHK